MPYNIFSILILNSFLEEGSQNVSLFLYLIFQQPLIATFSRRRRWFIMGKRESR